MQRLLSFSRFVDGLNGRIGRAASWLALLMVLLGAFNAAARWLGRFIGKDLSSNAYLEGQWYLFSLLFLLGAAWVHAPNGWVFSAPNGGWEYPVFLVMASVTQFLLGDGAWALKLRADAPNGEAASLARS